MENTGETQKMANNTALEESNLSLNQQQPHSEGCAAGTINWFVRHELTIK